MSGSIPRPKPLTTSRRSRIRNRESPEQIERRLREAEDRIDRRVSAAVDWATCCIPGCRKDLGILGGSAGDASKRLPLCNRHLVIIIKHGSVVWDDPDLMDARSRWAKRRVEDDDERQRRIENNGANGHIYFVRQNGLIKVGWSGRLESRLKQYGANVEILCHFPATRDDETLLHRQLRPYLARGREWYEDCPLLHDVVAGYVKQHGPPVIKPYWTKPKDPAVKLHRAS